jgi:polyphosphate kinase
MPEKFSRNLIEHKQALNYIYHMALKKRIIARDISWLSFNARVLQEANDATVPLKERIKFLGIFSNNTDEFYRVRVATLKRMIDFGRKDKFHPEYKADEIIEDIYEIVLQQQNEFDRIWQSLQKEMNRQKIFLLNEFHLSKMQQQFVEKFFDEEVESNVNPLMIETIPQFPYLRDKSVYLGVVMSKNDSNLKKKYALIEIPARALGRFVKLPSKAGENNIILLEDVIRYNLRYIFSYLGYDRFKSHLFKVTKDAEIDIDNDISTNIIQKIEKGLKNRRKGKPVRFVYDKEMDAGLLNFLFQHLGLSKKKDNIIPGGRIHNFRHFMDFPDVFAKRSLRKAPFVHPKLVDSLRVTDVVLKEDVMLHFPYHSYNSVIDLLREAAMDEAVTSIKVTAYRLASNSKVINALINAVRNGKQVTVMIELRARFEEEANLEWKERLEVEGVKVLIGFADMKVHAKLCIIKKRVNNKTFQYGFVSTGNLNEKTAKLYGDHCLLTANRNIMADINRIFDFIEKPKPGYPQFRQCKTLVLSPINMRKAFVGMINKEIRFAKAKKPASIILKMNSLSDIELIEKLYEAAIAGVEIKLIVRGIFCMMSELKKFKHPLFAISIVDEYLEHARVLLFHNGGNEKMFISSADWMVRNLDHRIEAAVPILHAGIKEELKNILNIQLNDNVKARILDNDLKNNYRKPGKAKRVRSQVEIYNFLQGVDAKTKVQ